MVKYSNIFETLKQGIISGKYDARHPIPSERALMLKYKVSRNMVRHAVDELEKAKLVKRQHGRRTNVVFGGRGKRIGLIPCVAESEFFIPLASKVSQLCTANGYALMVAMAGPRNVTDVEIGDYSEKVLAAAKGFVAQNVSGVLFQPISFLPNAQEVNEKVLSIFRAASVPVVLIDYDVVRPPDRSDCDVVGINNVDAAQRIVSHLVGLGAKRIHFFMRPNCSNVVLNRMRGVALAVVLAGLKWTKDSILSCALTDKRQMRVHLKGPECPDAVVCGFDTMALHLKSVIDSMHLKVPKDLMLAGFDDHESASFMNPPLTTIRLPSEDIAVVAFERLIRRIREPTLPAEEILLNAPLIVRGSTSQTKKERIQDE